MSKAAEIAQRLRQFGKNHFGSMSKLAEALDMTPQQLNDYLSGRITPGNKMQGRLREIGCDIEWLMTGEKKHGGLDTSPAVGDPIIAFHAPSGMSEEKRKQIQKMINELSKLDQGDVNKAREIVRAAFKKK